MGTTLLKFSERRIDAKGYVGLEPMTAPFRSVRFSFRSGFGIRDIRSFSLSIEKAPGYVSLKEYRLVQGHPPLP